MNNKSLIGTTKERWLSKVPAIIEQATLEATRHTSRFASAFKVFDNDKIMKLHFKFFF